MAGIANIFTKRITHLVALFLVAAAFALLLVTNATAPVNHHLALFTAWNPYRGYNEGNPAIRFGTYGYCWQVYMVSVDSGFTTSHPTPDRCTSAGIGYDPVTALNSISDVGPTGTTTERSLTEAMVIHPLATAFAFLTLVSSLFPTRIIPGIVSPAVGILTTVLALIAVACDFSLFRSLKKRLQNEGLAQGKYDTGIWLLLVAFICLVLATPLLTGRWLASRREPAATGANEYEMKDSEEGHTYRSSPAVSAVPPYEVADKPGCAELSQGNGSDRHELTGQDKGRVELEEQKARRFELGDTCPHAQTTNEAWGEI
ncbi:pali-domain-containing protein [Hypoxylon trugodes]|uniref:pali-domain-containing protein n=1 Tax=Hypoxylon trugodes TaxID=326681 RepID=UPI00219FCEE8|nr:pali-domain-containing protein [Hypoxylon trugodes]KAI1389290.1 pali-domain-containing protein [Hypoxylon trugodes]